MTDYTRPELTDDEITQAQDDARRLIRKYGMLQAVKIIALLAIENVKLSKEVNEHRARAGSNLSKPMRCNDDQMRVQ